METILQSVTDVLGIGTQPGRLSPLEMSMRAAVALVAGLAIVRLGDRRVIGTGTPFDLVVAFMLGSSFSRAVTGQAALVSTIVAMAVLVAAHRLLAFLAQRSPRMSLLLKGEPVRLVQEGRLCRDAMRRSHIEESDLVEAFRLQGELRNPASVQVAYLERNGRISVIPMNGAVAGASDRRGGPVNPE